MPVSASGGIWVTSSVVPETGGLAKLRSKTELNDAFAQMVAATLLGACPHLADFVDLGTLESQFLGEFAENLRNIDQDAGVA